MTITSYEVRFTVTFEAITPSYRYTESYSSDAERTTAILRNRDRTTDQNYGVYGRYDNGEIVWLADCGLLRDADQIMDALNFTLFAQKYLNKDA